MTETVIILDPRERELAAEAATEAGQRRFDAAWAVVRELTPGTIVRAVGRGRVHARFPGDKEVLFEAADVPTLRAVLALLGGDE